MLSGFVVRYNYGMAWEGQPQPLYRSVEVVVQTVTTVGDGADYVLSLASIVLGEEILSPGPRLTLIRTTVPGVIGDSLADADICNRTGCAVVAGRCGADDH